MRELWRRIRATINYVVYGHVNLVPAIRYAYVTLNGVRYDVTVTGSHDDYVFIHCPEFGEYPLQFPANEIHYYELERV